MADLPQWHGPGEDRVLVYEVIENPDPQAVASYASVLRAAVDDNALIHSGRLSPSGRYWLFSLETTKHGWDRDLVEQLPQEDEHNEVTVQLRTLCPDFLNRY